MKGSSPFYIILKETGFGYYLIIVPKVVWTDGRERGNDIGLSKRF